MRLTCPHCEQVTTSASRCTNCGESLRDEAEIPVLQELPVEQKPPAPNKAVNIVGVCIGIVFAVGTAVLIRMNREDRANPRPVVNRVAPPAAPAPPQFVEPPMMGKVEVIPEPPLPPGAFEGTRLPGANSAIASLAWDRNGTNLYAATHTEETWMVPPRGEPIRLLTAPESNEFRQWSSSSFSRNHDRVAVTHHGGHLSMGDLVSKQIRVLAHSQPTSTAQWNASFSPDGTKLATGHGDHKVRIWNLQSGQVDKVLDGFNGQVMSVTYNPFGTVLAAAAEKEVRLYAADTHELLGTLVGGGEFPFSRMEFLEDGSLVGLEGKKIHWIRLKSDGKSFAQTERTFFEFDELAIHFRVSSDRKQMLVAFIHKGVELWDGEKRTKLHSFPELHQTQGIAFHPTDDRIAVSQGNRVVFYDRQRIVKGK